MEERLMIGPLSKRTRVKIETIRYYEREKLLPPPPRSDGGYRLYGPEHLRRLVFIRRGRELGFSLDEIRGLLQMVDGGYTCGEVQDLTLDHLAGIRKKLTDLRRLERTLKTIAAQCDGATVSNCPVIDALFD